ncbi:MAG: hypothetical protein FWC91_02185 [Defluviitaleaceae bacterium]|nr:hypothetical protein [Defluviitaleaceae bacterium]
MSEIILDINAVPSYLIATLRVKKVKVQEANHVITILPIEESVAKKDYSCPFLGIASDSKLTVDKFLEWKSEERDAEYEKELHS